MLKIRLARGGRKKLPYYRIVVTNVTSPRDSKFLEKIGTHNPLLEKTDANRVTIVKDRAEYWLSVGAQPTEKVAKFLRDLGVKGAEKHQPAFVPKKKGDGLKKKALEKIEADKEKAAEAAAAAEAEAKAANEAAEQAAADAAAKAEEEAAAAAKAAEDAAAKAAEDAAAKAAEEAAAATEDAAASASDGLMTVDGFNFDKVAEKIDGSSLSSVQKTLLKTTLDQAKDNPDALKAVLDQIKTALGM